MEFVAMLLLIQLALPKEMDLTQIIQYLMLIKLVVMYTVIVQVQPQTEQGKDLQFGILMQVIQP